MLRSRNARYLSAVAALLTAMVALTTAALLAATTPGQAACSALATQLGSAKVERNPVSASFISTLTTYYSSQQASNIPACIVAPTAYADVQTAMRVIRTNNATFAVKAGGHQTNNYWSSVAGGVLIDFKSMTAKTYDPITQTAYYQPGNRWKPLYHYYAQFNRTVVGGRISGVGSGLALGGGLSFLSAEYGLACDGFQKLDVVLADGSLVQATKTNKYKDLLFSLKGGGNQFGIVVGYTVDAPAIGDVWGGLLVYTGDAAQAVMEQALNFTNTNTDPRAAVIATLEVLGTPGLPIELQVLGVTLPPLDSFVLLFNVYDGPDGRALFQQFENIPHLLDTRKRQTYPEIADMVAPGDGPTGQSGSVSYRAATHASSGATAISTLQQALSNFLQFAKDAKGSYDILSFDVQPVQPALVRASRARGGNALQSTDAPHYFINYLHSSIPGTPGVDASLSKLKQSVEKTPNSPGFPIFLNDANGDQPILQSYGAYDTLKLAKAKYDPDNYLSSHMGGPRFT